MAGFEFGKGDSAPTFLRDEGPPRCPGRGFAQRTTSSHDRWNDLIFSLATQLSFQSIIPRYIKKKSPCHISACAVLRLPCQGICRSIALTITSHISPSSARDVTLISNAFGSGVASPAPGDAVEEAAHGGGEQPGGGGSRALVGGWVLAGKPAGRPAHALQVS